ncbi:MAG: SAM-dependent methyltransferase [Pseudomonadota bacterium]|nr:SAM-dependent methyltransferase [Pseudomonadota bacterium]
MRRDVALDAEELRHAARVSELIAGELAAAGGWISFERYMELALYAPGLGYYSAGARKLGKDGDFITAPEISPLFGACIANQCSEILDELSGGAILEVGAGTGRLAVDTLTRLETLGRLPDRYYILEVSADLRDRQHRLARRSVPHLFERIEWVDTPPQHPFDGVILANEVLDALPVARFRWHESFCEELGVAFADGVFQWSARPCHAAMEEHCRRLATAAGGWDAGYVSEYCPRLGAWSRTVAQSLRAGAALWFDYGLPRPQYYLPERNDGTLICHFRQRVHEDPFLHPGLQDISAWVDFTALAEACGGAGCELAGFTTQAFFLAGLAIDREMRSLAGEDENQFARLANQAKRLMLPGEMGERFKAMAWTRGLQRQLSGFALQDLRHTL